MEVNCQLHACSCFLHAVEPAHGSHWIRPCLDLKVCHTLVITSVQTSIYGVCPLRLVLLGVRAEKKVKSFLCLTKYHAKNTFHVLN
jgi:hypothetical protein